MSPEPPPPPGCPHPPGGVENPINKNISNNNHHPMSMPMSCSFVVPPPSLPDHPKRKRKRNMRRPKLPNHDKHPEDKSMMGPYDNDEDVGTNRLPETPQDNDLSSSSSSSSCQWWYDSWARNAQRLRLLVGCVFPLAVLYFLLYHYHCCDDWQQQYHPMYHSYPSGEDSSTTTTTGRTFPPATSAAPLWMYRVLAFRKQLFLNTIEPVIVLLLGPASNNHHGHGIGIGIGNHTTPTMTRTMDEATNTEEEENNNDDDSQQEQQHRRLNFLPTYISNVEAFHETSMSFATLIMLCVTLSAVFLVCLACFYHNQKTSPLFVSPRRHRLPKLVPPPLPVDGYFSWLSICFYLSDEEIIHRIGYDSLIFLRFHRLALRCIVKMSVFSFVVLLPLNFTGGGHANAADLKEYVGSLFFTDFLRFTMANVMPGSLKLWVHCFAAYLLTGIVVRELLIEYETFNSIRHRYLLSREPHLRTVLVTNIPRNLRSSHKITSYFQHVYPNGAVKNVLLCQNLIELERLVQERTAILSKIEMELLLLCRSEKKKLYEQYSNFLVGSYYTNCCSWCCGSCCPTLWRGSGNGNNHKEESMLADGTTTGESSFRSSHTSAAATGSRKKKKTKFYSWLLSWQLCCDCWHGGVDGAQERLALLYNELEEYNTQIAKEQRRRRRVMKMLDRMEALDGRKDIDYVLSSPFVVKKNHQQHHNNNNEDDETYHHHPNKAPPPASIPEEGDEEAHSVSSSSNHQYNHSAAMGSPAPNQQQQVLDTTTTGGGLRSRSPSSQQPPLTNTTMMNTPDGGGSSHVTTTTTNSNNNNTTMEEGDNDPDQKLASTKKAKQQPPVRSILKSQQQQQTAATTDPPPPILKAKHAIRRYSRVNREVSFLGRPIRSPGSFGGVNNNTNNNAASRSSNPNSNNFFNKSFYYKQRGKNNNGMMFTTISEPMEQHLNEVTDKAFVVMRTYTAATIAIQSMHSSKPGSMQVATAPEPRDILWPNIYVSKGAQRTRSLIGEFAVKMLVCFYIIPIATVALLVSESALVSSSPRLAQLDQASAIFSVAIAMVQPICIVGLQQLLPPLFVAIGEAEGRTSFSEVQMQAFSRYFLFQVLNVFLVTTIAGTIFDTIAIIIEKPESAFEMLGNSLPRMSSFFITFVIMKTFLGLGMEMVRVVALVQGVVRFLIFPNATLRMKRQVLLGLRPMDDPGWFPFHKILAQDMLVVVISVVFAVVAPLVLLPCALFCLLSRVMWTHQHLYVYESVFESGGQFWPKIFRRFVFGLIIAQMTITGQFILKEARHEAYATMALMFMTYFFLRSTRARYDPTSSTLPLEVATVMDITLQQEEEEKARYHHMKQQEQERQQQRQYEEEGLLAAGSQSSGSGGANHQRPTRQPNDEGFDPISPPLSSSYQNMGSTGGRGRNSNNEDGDDDDDDEEEEIDEPGRLIDGRYDPFRKAYVQPALRANPKARPEQPFPPAQLGREETFLAGTTTTTAAAASSSSQQGGDGTTVGSTSVDVDHGIHHDSGASVRVRSMNQHERKFINRWWKDQLQRAGPQNTFMVLIGEECGTLTLSSSPHDHSSAPNSDVGGSSSMLNETHSIV